MPRFNLRQSDGTLDPLAPFKVLAVMGHPNELAAREEMLALLHSETAHGTERRRGLSDDEFLRAAKLSSGRAVIAGCLLLTLLQLHLNGSPASLNRALLLVRKQMTHWDNYDQMNWSCESHVGHRPGSRRKMLDAFREYRTVSHLWAALVHAEQHDKLDIWPGSVEMLPTFLGFADCFLDMACSLPSSAHNRRFVLTRSEAWTFTVPEGLMDTVILEALPFHEAQQRVLNEHEALNSLI